MMSFIRCAGIDVSKEKLHIVLLESDSAVHHVFPNTLSGWQNLSRWLGSDSQSQVHVCLEATGRYSDGIAHHPRLWHFK